MDNDEKNWGKPPAWRGEDDIHRRLRDDIHDRLEARMRRRACAQGSPLGGLVPGAIILAVGVIFLLDSLGYVRARQFLQFWPLLLIAGGAMAMWSAIQARKAMPSAPQGTLDPRNTLDENAIFGGVEKRLNSREFRGGRLQAIFGGIELDLRDAEMSETEAVIHANAIFGGIELRVPETWYVAARGQGVFGGFSDSTRFSPPADPDKPKKTLLVLGTALFGGVEIRN